MTSVLWVLYNLAEDLRRQAQTLFLPEGHDNIYSARSAEENVRVSLRGSVANKNSAPLRALR